MQRGMVIPKTGMSTCRQQTFGFRPNRTGMIPESSENNCLVVEPTPLKNDGVISQLDDWLFPIWWESHKNI